MSLFGGGAECSTARNPLAQFTKHTNEDRSLQRPSFTSQFQSQSIREEVHMNQQDQQHMNQFFNAQDNKFNFQPMHNELTHIQSNPQVFQSKPQASNWSSDFHSVGSLNHNQHQHQHNHGTNENCSWCSEFQNGAALNANQATLQPRTQSPSIRSGAFPFMRGGNVGGFNPMLSNNNLRFNAGIQPIQANSKIVEVGDKEQWDDKFKEIDEQFHQGLSKQEGKQIDEEEQKEAQRQNKQELDEEIIIDDKYQANFEEIWESLNQENEDLLGQGPASWEKDFATYAQARANFGQYNFENSNQFLHAPNAYEIGLTLMENGAKLSEAALAFEAAIQENPKHIDAWLKLGEVQTQNEKEIAGLTALEKCLSLDPKNLSALMTLAVSYINEGYDNAAFATLERWIETKYPQITEKARSSNSKINDEDRYSLHKRVTELFIQAAQLSPSGANIDADVQMGLGVLFYANEEFNKTIDCFKAAIAVRPNDELLWNRLGASLANSNRPEEAIEAYHKALQLKPSFVRARYNLGVSSINIGCYKEAAEHLLAALSMHNVEGSDQNNANLLNSLANQSTSILETLKRAFIAMERRDLLEKVKPGMDLNQFRNEFEF